MEHSIIYKRADVYSCFPSLLKLPDSRLITGFSTREYASHVDHSGGSLNMVSSDGGRSWIETIEKPVNPSWMGSDTRMARADANGWRYTSADRRRELEADGMEVRMTPSGEAAYAYGVHAETSHDGGATWLERPVEYPHRPLTMSFHENATFIRLSDTSVMRLVYSRTKANRRYYELRALRSEDNGLHWTSTVVACDPSERTGYGESSIIRCANGDLLVMMRTETLKGTADYMSMTRSTDEGLTWSTPEATNIKGHPPDLLMLSNGHILCTFGYRKDPMGIRAMISTDDGRTFSDETLTVLRSDGKRSADGGRGGDLGYPISVQIDDESIFTIYYMTCADGITHVAGTHWNEEEAGR